MHDLLTEESPDRFTVVHQVKDDGGIGTGAKKKELRLEEEEEDFLDEGKL